MIYKYNQDGYILGGYQANDTGFVPSGFTDVPPSEFDRGYIPRWNGTSWNNVVDYRGTVLYDKNNGDMTKWSHFTLWVDEVYTTIEPIGSNEIWDNDTDAWREKTEEEQHQDNVAKLGRKTIRLFDTEWFYDLEAQTERQLAELLRRKYSNKTIVVDAWGNERRLSSIFSNRLQKAQFEQYMKDKGVTP